LYEVARILLIVLSAAAAALLVHRVAGAKIEFRFIKPAVLGGIGSD
jgi:hypothetical protein